MDDRREFSDAQVREMADKFLVDFLPRATPQEHHELLLGMLVDVRANIARHLSACVSKEE